jgi:hypothetical protein
MRSTVSPRQPSPSRRPTAWLVTLLAAALTAACVGDGPAAPPDVSLIAGAPMASEASGTCQNVAGTLVGNVLPPPGEMYPVPSLLDGDLQGMVTAYAAPIDEQMGAGAILLTTFHLFLLPDGTFSTVDRGVMAPRNPPYYRLNNRYTIQGGTGAWEGASGHLQIHGTLIIDYLGLHPDNGSIDATYRGRICRPA